MQNYRYLVLIYLTLFFLSPFKVSAKTGSHIAAKKQNNSIDGYIITQNSQEYGQLSTLFSLKGVKFITDTAVIIVKPPDFNVNIINTKEHLIFTETIAKYNIKRSNYYIDQKNSKVKFEVKPDEKPYDTIDNFKVNNYKYYKTEINVRRVNICDFSTVKPPNTPAKMMDVCSQLAYLPTGYGLPVRYSKYEWHHGKRIKKYLLNTYSIKPAKINLNEFIIPKNLTKVDSEMAVVMGCKRVGKNDNLKDLFKTDY